ncbi:MAG TPA: hypothetical protein VJT31_28445 [Rugosimonospora sp.]|nr:hypothetical protein [Rugosimonospora sp.]
MDADESRPQTRRGRPVERVSLPPGPARDLREVVYGLYAQADCPPLDVLARQIAADDTLPGSPKKDLIGKIVSGDGLASQRDTVTVAVALCRAADRGDSAAIAENVRQLWITARAAPPPTPPARLGRPISDCDPLVLEVHPAIQLPDTSTAEVLPAYVPPTPQPATHVNHVRIGSSGRFLDDCPAGS